MAEAVVFWDTAAFVALGNARDNLHQAAVAVSQELAQVQAHVLTTDAVLIEVVNTLSRVNWRPTAGRLIEMMKASVQLGTATIVHVDVELWERGWQLHQDRSDKDWSLTDCISFEVMQEYGIQRAFTFDHHFEQAGFIRLLK